MSITKGQLRLLLPYLEGDTPSYENQDGTKEWNMQCPLHDDARRSASLNVDKGYWNCHANCGGGPVSELIKVRDKWLAPSANGHHTNGSGPKQRKIEALPTQSSVVAWSASLMSDEAKLEELIALRGLTTDTIRKFDIGWSINKSVYTIPVYNAAREIISVRYYNPHPGEGRRKIWGVTGHNTPHLYPQSSLEGEWDYIVICEGEWDALVTIQNGFRAITRTAAAGVWHSEWNSNFADKIVYLCHDADDTGVLANKKVARALRGVAREIRIIKLPFEHQAKHGQDLTDFWSQHDREDFERLLRDAERFGEDKTAMDDPDVITVLDSFDAQRVGQPVKMVVTIKGRKEPGYSIPEIVKLSCTRDAGAKCVACPLNGKNGEDELHIGHDDPVVLGMLEVSKPAVEKELLTDYGVPGGRCPKLDVEVEKYQAVEILFARPSLDHSDGTKAGDYKNVKITSVGRHDTMSNNTVLLTGALYPSPRSHSNEFLAWDVIRTEASFDRFKLNDQNIELMKRFQSQGGRPIQKMATISKALARHVTRIHGRPEMHVMMDLVFHGVLAWKFAGEFIDRGWVEGLIVGDTRTGKSLAATRLVRHYGAGEIISCEAASFAGIVGGVQQMNGKDWAVTWGAIPINDRRLVVLDEISGLTPEEISQMSDVRSSGVAKLTKIMQDMTHARTRLLWLGNPRDATLSNFTYGVDALKPLIGNAEDIARYDIAMAASLYDVPAAEINMIREGGELTYSSEACHSVLMWAWSRSADQVVWAPGSIEKVFELSNEMGTRYTEDPPLVQAANIRIKIARLAVSMAARLFSTDSSYENIVVRPEHVADAVWFLDKVYGMTAFGYAERSRERINDRNEAESKRDAIKQYLLGRPTLAKFLKSAGKFRRQDLEEITNLSREEANAVINTLWEARMVWKDKGDVRVEPTLHSLLREVKL